MRFDRDLIAFLLLLSTTGCVGNSDNTPDGTGKSTGDSPVNHADSSTVNTATNDSMERTGGDDGSKNKIPNEPANMIQGWGTSRDPAGGTKIELKDTTLVMISPAAYVDNFPKGAVNAPWVMQEVSGDFTAEVNVTHVDPALPDSVLKSLGGFSTAYHAGSLIVRTNEKNLIRFERVSKNTKGILSTTCELQVYEKGKQKAYASEKIEDIPTQLRLERRGNLLLSSFSQDNGKTWKELPQHKLGMLLGKVKIGVSLTNNTDPGCTVKFQDLKIVQRDGQ